VNAWRPVDGANLAEGMTFRPGDRVYTIKGIAQAAQGVRRRNAWVRDSEGAPGALAVYGGTTYLALDAGHREREPAALAGPEAGQ
jgi:hypothetical protein